jgi:hypothetical protein
MTAVGALTACYVPSSLSPQNSAVPTPRGAARTVASFRFLTILSCSMRDRYLKHVQSEDIARHLGFVSLFRNLQLLQGKLPSQAIAKAFIERSRPFISSRHAKRRDPVTGLAFRPLGEFERARC